jgi:hypothetical protein
VERERSSPRAAQWVGGAKPSEGRAGRAGRADVRGTQPQSASRPGSSGGGEGGGGGRGGGGGICDFTTVLGGGAASGWGGWAGVNAPRTAVLPVPPGRVCLYLLRAR